LASTKKTGRLLLHGDRGEGSVWLTDGQVTTIQTAASPDGDAGDGLFDLLRARDGGFSFETGTVADADGPCLDVEPLLHSTEKRLAEWREIEAVVPSLHAWVALVPEVAEPEVTIDAATWRLVATIGSGMTVGDLGRMLDLAEVPVCRVVRDLVTLGLGVVADAPAQPAWEPTADAFAPALNGHADATFGSSFDEPTPAFADLPAFGEEPESAPDPAPVADGWDDLDTLTPVEAEVAFVVDEANGYHAEPTDEIEPAPVPEPFVEDDADEVARQLAMLSPRAAQAVAAAAAADSDDERDAHLDAIDDGEEPINRGLLLKFLSSVKS
jgi:hypothetical protein